VKASVLREAPGRVCPTDYHYAPSVLSRAPDLTADILYVVGGLYGNLAALKQIEWLAFRERQPVTIVFNGDFHWFDAEPAWFAAIEKSVSRHHAIRGNVETELARTRDIAAGCGCAYPEGVDDETVARSNAILEDLRKVTSRDAAARFGALPMHLVARVGSKRVGIVHGDATALAGWRFAHDALDDRAHAAWLNEVRAQSAIDIFAATHTCLAALRDFDTPAGRLTIVNNGSAGMANFHQTTFGLISRIATGPSPHPALYGARHDDVFVDALAVDYDLPAFLAKFDARWPDGSAAHASYHPRIVGGPPYPIEQAQGRVRSAA
jgi:hypothetical protein